MGRVGNCYKDLSTKMDHLFLQNYPIHPMTALFISLPLEGTPNTIEVRIPNPVDPIAITCGNFSKGDEIITGYLPQGMPARRILLYFFHHFFVDPNFYYRVDDLHKGLKSFLNDIGYMESRNRRLSPLKVHLIRFLKASVKFANLESLQRAHYAVNDEYMASHLMFGLSADKAGNITSIRQNPYGLFNMAFPIDIKHIYGTRKKCFFWDIYVFFVDVLPRVKWSEKKRISWEMVHTVFCKRLTDLNRFKYLFKKEVEEVLKIYPEAVGKIDLQDKHDLILQFAPAPMKKSNPPPFDPEPDPPDEPEPLPSVAVG